MIGGRVNGSSHFGNGITTPGADDAGATVEFSRARSSAFARPAASAPTCRSKSSSESAVAPASPIELRIRTGSAAACSRCASRSRHSVNSRLRRLSLSACPDPAVTYAASALSREHRRSATSTSYLISVEDLTSPEARTDPQVREVGVPGLAPNAPLRQATGVSSPGSRPTRGAR
ncbi:hypothetical protein SAMN06295924_10391 [Rathayibacter rathayi NCPPB 2980 = VKM Ac-1601]|nr:hypothetical protein FB469_2709 [Rathayibacter rathayi]SOE03952.1 hypothetical protein SAMN06295924_10391 [Rathayibacter rathayi NCPPB 2980 = VKM Ac-1601]